MNFLWQVAKEHLAAYKGAKAIKNPPNPDLNSNEYLHHILQKREDYLFNSLGHKMKAAGKDVFSEWMYNQSDLIQAAARSYGERLISDQCFKSVEEVGESLHSILQKIHRLYMLDIIEKDLGTLIISGILPTDLAQQVGDVCRQACKDLAPDCLALTEAFGVTDAMLSAPISRDWVKYNEYDNQGEVVQEFKEL